MAFPPVLPPSDWEALKIASIKGVPDADLARMFGVETNAIRQKRFNDPVWSAAKHAAAPVKAPTISNETSEKIEDVTLKVTHTPETLSSAQKVASTISDSISRLGEQNRLLALQIAGKGLKQADAAPPDVQSWQDVKALMEIVVKASGFENSQAVQVNILASEPVEFAPHFEA